MKRQTILLSILLFCVGTFTAPYWLYLLTRQGSMQTPVLPAMRPIVPVGLILLHEHAEGGPGSTPGRHWYGYRAVYQSDQKLALEFCERNRLEKNDVGFIPMPHPTDLEWWNPVLPLPSIWGVAALDSIVEPNGSHASKCAQLDNDKLFYYSYGMVEP